MRTTVSGSSVERGASNAAPPRPVESLRTFWELRVDPRSTFRWRRFSTSIAVMIALMQIPRAGAAEPRAAPFKPPRLVHFVEAVLPTGAGRAARSRGRPFDRRRRDRQGRRGRGDQARGRRRGRGARPGGRRGRSSICFAPGRPTDIRSRCALRIAIVSCSSPLCVRPLRPPPPGPWRALSLRPVVRHRAPSG